MMLATDTSKTAAIDAQRSPSLTVYSIGASGVGDMTMVGVGVSVGGLVGVGLSVIGIVTNWKPVKVLSYLAFFYAFFGFINSQATYVANIFVSIDGTTFSTGFILTAVAFVLAILTALVAVIATKTKKEEVPANA